MAPGALRRMARRSVLVFGLAIGLCACHQNGTTFVVDTTDDTVDVTPGDGLCADAEGDCSLRAAVMESNALPGVEEIRLVDGATYALSIEPVGSDDASSGDLNITEGVVVTGKGMITIDPELLDVYGVFHADEANGLVEIDGPSFYNTGTVLRVTNSSASIRHANIIGFVAPAVNLESGTLWLWASSIRGNPSGSDPIIAADAGRMDIQNLTAAGLYSVGPVLEVTDADVTLVSSAIVENSHLSEQSSVVLDPNGNGSLIVQRSAIAVRALTPVACSGPIVGLGNNVASDESCGFDGPGDQIIEYPVTSSIDSQPGAVDVFVLDPTSPLINAGGPGPCTSSGLDARAQVRPQGGLCDVGPFEVDIGFCQQPGPGVDLHRCDFRGVTWPGIDLSGADLTGALLRDADLTGADLRGADLSEASLTFTEFAGADLTDAVLRDSDGPMRLDGANLTRADLRGAEAISAVGADFSDANGAGFHVWSFGQEKPFTDAIFDGADFSGPGGGFARVVSGGIVGTPAALPDWMVLERGHLYGFGTIVSGADLSGLDLSAAAFAGGTAIGTDLSDTVLRGSYNAATLDSAVLDGADMATVSLTATRLRSSSVVAADLSQTYAISSDWTEAIVVGSDLSGSDLRLADFTDAILLLNTWDNTTCPSGVNSDDNGGNCDGQFTQGEPSVGGGAAVPAEFEGMSLEDLATGGLVDD